MRLYNGDGIQETSDLMMLMEKAMSVVSVEFLLRGVVRRAKCQETIARWVILLLYPEHSLLIWLFKSGVNVHMYSTCIACLSGWVLPLRSNSARWIVGPGVGFPNPINIIFWQSPFQSLRNARLAREAPSQQLLHRVFQEEAAEVSGERVHVKSGQDIPVRHDYKILGAGGGKCCKFCLDDGTSTCSSL